MKLLFINHEFPPIGGGGAVFTNLLSSELASSYDCSIKVITCSDKNKDYSFSPHKNLEIIRINTGRTHRVNVNFKQLLYFLFKSYITGKKIIKKNKIDIINVFFSNISGIPGFLLHKKFNIPLIISVLGADIFDPTRLNLLHPAFKLINTLVFHSSSSIVTASNDMKNRVLSYYKKKSVIIPHCLNPTTFNVKKNNFLNTEFNISKKQTVILSVSRLVERKNLLFAIKLVISLILKGLNIKYIIIGEGPKRQQLQDIIDKFEMNDNIILAGRVTADELPLYYINSDIFFMPSIHEAFGISAIEAQYCGLPVICSDTGGLSDIIIEGKTGYKCSLNNQNMISKKMEYLIKNKSIRKKMGENGKLNVLNKYTVDLIASQYYNLYKTF